MTASTTRAPSSTIVDDEQAWHAVLDRSAAHDGRFVYAVATTGVYCRPTCPSRRPRRANVAFFATADAAERRGFRACLRCRPRDGADPTTALAARVCAAIDRAVADAEPVTLRALGAAVGRSPYHLQRLFRRVMGISPRAYAAQRRLGGFRRALRTARSVTDAVYDAGYGSSSRAYDAVGTRLGMTPGAYRRAGAGARIAFTTLASPLGRLLVAATTRGLCAVRFGASDRALAHEFRAEFPRATITGPDRRLGAWAATIVAAIAGGRPHVTLPLDLRATAFQRQVWEELRRIPVGETRTYGAIAAALGRPRAARAVARACASNRVAVVIPCHRAVPASGATGGYRWGARRKRALLARERAAR